MKIDLNTSLKNNTHENSLTKMTNKNSIDEQFIEDLGENCSSPLIWQTTAHIIQKYIKQLVIHEVDVITDSSQIENVQFIQEVEK